MSALALALEAIDKSTAHDTDPSHQLIAAKSRGLMRGYDARWGGQGFTATAIESLVTSDLWNPDTQRKSRSFTVAGVIDVTGERHGRAVVLDHKTTSQDISDPNAPYWRQLVVESQASHYMLLEWLNGRKVDESVWDVIRKPGISPKGLAKADVQRAVMTKTYCGQPLDQDSLLSVQQDGRETIAMYEARLAHDCTTERPEWYFQRRTIPRLDSEILEYAGELWQHSQELLHVRRLQRYARNSGACMLYGSPCQFLGICSGHDTPDSDRWKRKAWVHNELVPIEGTDGREILTNSRIRCFQTCRRKEYYEYELGIERLEEEEKEALYFGTLIHEALAAWFGHFLKGEVLNGNITGSADIEFATANDGNNIR
jgi:PD-(D/E)XK nuclease superfamily